ncbi:MAG TPA: Rieske 2Fe-2S domain-containing protein [Acidimicrobiales bacterium]|nr:Rieske 2Fe-2S domain-containing protein [Acidimicrobiales bacterium]
MDRQTGLMQELTPKERRANRVVLACFGLAALAAVGFIVVYWAAGTDMAALGGTVGACFLLLAAGLGHWSHELMPEGPFEEEYPTLRSPATEEAETLATLDRGGIARRRALLGALGVVGAALGAGAVSTLRSLGPSPESLVHTPWRGGRLAVTPEGDVVRASDVPVNSVVSIFPQGFTTAPDAQALLIRLPPGLNRPLPGRASWAPDGFVCYSKVCSHAGCPVNLYNREKHQMQCPCHQSTFDVLRGAEVLFGPAGAPLVQLPLAITADGLIRSTGDFSGPPGPVFWHKYR